MEANGWDFGPDNEELFEFAMHERQYRDYKSGVAKKRFQDELNKLRKEKQNGSGKKATQKDTSKKDIASPSTGRILFNINYYVHERAIEAGTHVNKGDRICYIESNNTFNEILSEYEGEVADILVDQGDFVKQGDVLVRLK